MVKKFKKCVLHIGAEKTGTTAVQAFFYENRARLLDFDIFYPDSLYPANQIYLTAAALDKSKVDDDILLRCAYNLDVPPEQILPELHRRFEQEIADVQANTLLLSNEHLHSRLISIEEKAALKAFLQPYYEEIEIHFYVRRQDKASVSFFSTLLKSGNAEMVDYVWGERGDEIDEQIFPGINEKNLPYYFDFYRVAEEYSQVFGDVVKVKIYERDGLFKKNIIHDFCHSLGIVVDDSFSAIKDRNKSVDAGAILFLAGINPYLPAFVDGKPSELRADLVELLEQLAGPEKINVERMVARRYFEKFRESNEKLRERWFPDRERIFSEDFDDYPVEVASELSRIAKCFEIMAALWLQKEAQISTLNGELAAARQEAHAIWSENKALKLERSRVSDAIGDSLAQITAQLQKNSDAQAQVALQLRQSYDTTRLELVNQRERVISELKLVHEAQRQAWAEKLAQVETRYAEDIKAERDRFDAAFATFAGKSLTLAVAPPVDLIDNEDAGSEILGLEPQLKDKAKI
jgi:hypothetical protein